MPPAYAAALPARLAALRMLVYRSFAEAGAPPSPAQAATALGLGRDEVLVRLRDLHDAHQLVLVPGGDAIRMAHPFSSAPMGFVLRAGDDRLWWGGCAWDSFGIVAALAEELELLTRCRRCGRELRFPVGPATPPPDLVVRLPRPAAEWWSDVVATCSDIRLFCDEAHARTYADAAGLPPGAVVPAEQMWRLALPWYGNRLDPAYRPYAPGYKQQLLAEAGLTGPFWQL